MSRSVASESSPVFVPFALRLDQAEHVWGAVEAVLRSCREAGRPAIEYAPLSAALITMTLAIEKARSGEGGNPESPLRGTVGDTSDVAGRGRNAP